MKETQQRKVDLSSSISTSILNPHDVPFSVFQGPFLVMNSSCLPDSLYLPVGLTLSCCGWCPRLVQQHVHVFTSIIQINSLERRKSLQFNIIGFVFNKIYLVSSTFFKIYLILQVKFNIFGIEQLQRELLIQAI